MTIGSFSPFPQETVASLLLGTLLSTLCILCRFLQWSTQDQRAKVSLDCEPGVASSNISTTPTVSLNTKRPSLPSGVGQSLLEAPNSVVSRDSVNCLPINSRYISAMNTWALLHICLNLHQLFIEYLVSARCEHPCMPAYMVVSRSTTRCVLLW